MSSNNEMCYNAKTQTFSPTKHTQNVHEHTQNVHEGGAMQTNYLEDCDVKDR